MYVPALSTPPSPWLRFVSSRTHCSSIEEALRAWGTFSSHPDRFSRAVVAIADVIAMDGSTQPTFYVTAGGHYVGVLADGGDTLADLRTPFASHKNDILGMTNHSGITWPP
jgi:hypothetical protein